MAKENTWRRRFLVTAVVLSGSVCGALLYLGGVGHGRSLAQQGHIDGEDEEATSSSSGSSSDSRGGAAMQRVMPGEFEPQDALLITWPSRRHPFILEQPQNDRAKVLAALNRLYVDIISATHQRLKIISLIADEATRAEVSQVIQRASLPKDAVQLLRTPVVDLWTRDFGPLLTKTSAGSCIMVETDYLSDGRLVGSQRVGGFLAAKFKLPLEEVDLSFEGGNLLSNGAGLCITTKTLLIWNPKGQTLASLAKLIQRRFGATEVLFLEPLPGEYTGHVDMQATFTAPDTVVVGEISAELDPTNAKILNENAERLAQVVTPCGRLQVHRVPLLPQGQGEWLSYTNVIYANGVLLAPRYSQVDPQLQANVYKTYQKLLPGWRIVPVDADVLPSHDGSLHCVALNLFRTRE